MKFHPITELVIQSDKLASAILIVERSQPEGIRKEALLRVLYSDATSLGEEVDRLLVPYVGAIQRERKNGA